jgi:NAD(P)-dependent dehydrogenase (short-subunit alcohol dehydrogenase family)
LLSSSLRTNRETVAAIRGIPLRFLFFHIEILTGDIALFDLSGRTAVITGGSTGIGMGIAHALAAAGCNVMLSGRNTERLQQAVERIRAAGGIAAATAGDVADEVAVQHLFAETDRLFGPLDLLVNNAGAFDGGPVEEVSLEAWNRVIGACLTGAFLCTREAFRRMKPRQSGRVLNIGSISAQRPRMNSAPYTASKFGVLGLTHATALEGRAHGISVSCLHPGNVLVERRVNSGLTSDEEPMMTVEAITRAAITMLTMPPNVNFLEAIVLPTEQLYIGRG